MWPPAHLRNTDEYLKRLKNSYPGHQLPQDAIVFSIDVVNLYGSIPLAEGVSAVAKISKSNPWKLVKPRGQRTKSVSAQNTHAGQPPRPPSGKPPGGAGRPAQNPEAGLHLETDVTGGTTSTSLADEPGSGLAQQSNPSPSTHAQQASGASVPA